MAKFLTHAEKPPVFKSKSAFFRGFDEGRSGILWSVPLTALELSVAQRGEIVPTMTGRAAGMVSYPLLSGAISAGLAMIPGVNVATASMMAMFLAMYPNSAFESGISRSVRFLNDWGRQVRHLEFGGQYQDTETAFQQRQLAAQAITAAMPAARRYLGQEALFFHR